MYPIYIVETGSVERNRYEIEYEILFTHMI